MMSMHVEGRASNRIGAIFLCERTSHRRRGYTSHSRLRRLRFRAMHSKLLSNRKSTPSGRGSAWLERLVRDQEVGGSNPLAPTT